MATDIYAVWLFVNSTNVFGCICENSTQSRDATFKVDNFVGNGWGHSDTNLQPNGCKQLILLHVKCVTLSQHGQFGRRKFYVLKREVLWACGCHSPFPDLFIIWVLAAAVFGLSYYCSQHDWFFSGYFSERFQKPRKIMHSWLGHMKVVGSSIYKSFTVLWWHFGLSLKGPFRVMHSDVMLSNKIRGWAQRNTPLLCGQSCLGHCRIMTALVDTVLHSPSKVIAVCKCQQWVTPNTLNIVLYSALGLQIVVNM